MSGWANVLGELPSLSVVHLKLLRNKLLKILKFKILLYELPK